MGQLFCSDPPNVNICRHFFLRGASVFPEKQSQSFV